MKRVFTLSDKAHGPGSLYFSWQKAHGNYLATTGFNETVNVYDRHGKQKDSISLPGMCSGLGWDKDGDILAMVTDKSSLVFLWDSNTQKTFQMDSGFKDSLTFLLWSKTSPMLAIGSSKGNLLMYNHQTSRKIPIIGKHTKRISCGAWNSQNLLALGSDDKQLTISNSEGDTIRQTGLRAEPSDIQFSEMKMEERSAAAGSEQTVSMILGKKTLFLFNLDDPDNPVELAFQQRYGNVVSYRWYGDGYIVIGFSAGYFVCISTHMKEIGQELFQSRNHKDNLTDITVNLKNNKAASCGDNTIKVHDLTDLKEIYAIIDVEEERQLDRIGWTDDGQLLAVSSPRGYLYVYLSRLPTLGDAYHTKLAYLTSLLEVTVSDPVTEETALMVQIDVEPAFMAIGPDCLGVGMNNRVWFYYLEHTHVSATRDREYLGSIQQLKINDGYAAVLFEGKVQLHLLEGDGDGDNDSRLFPEPPHSDKITHMALEQAFLIYGTEGGGVHIFDVEEWRAVGEYHHVCAVRKVYPDQAGGGCRIVFIDEKSDGYIYNPLNDEVVDIPSFPNTAKGVVWETLPSDKGVFGAFDDDKVHLFAYARETIYGAKCDFIGTTKLPYSHVPLILHGGDFTCITQGGKLASLQLDTHKIQSKLQGMPPTVLKDTLKKMQEMRRWSDAFSICQVLNTRELWDQLAQTALEHLEVDFAIRVYRTIGDVGMVWSLQSIKHIEDVKLLSGHIALFLCKFDVAQDLYLESSYPQAALEMRRDLLHWDQALELAKRLDPAQLPFICKEYAQQLEFIAEYRNALLHYERGVTGQPDHSEHDAVCDAGIARMSLRVGDIRRGVGIAMQSENRSLKRECATILENMKQLAEAGVLYEKGGYHDKAAQVFMRMKNWNKVGELLANVQSPKIHMQYAKAREQEGKFDEALKAYDFAKSWEDCVRIYLDNLKNPDAAVRIVRENQSIEGAKMIAKFFMKLNDYGAAIQFLILSRCFDEAFKLAQQHGKMDIYGDILAQSGLGTQEDYQSIALYFENEKKSLQAGRYFLLCGQFARALRHLLRASQQSHSPSDDSGSIDLAIECVGRASDDMLTHQLIDFLMGETDGIPKDAKFLFKLYMALKQYREAARTAIIIAREEQNSGSYRGAHDVLLGMYRELRKQGIRIPAEMVQNLMILHSYTLVRLHVNRNEHVLAARLLIRVAQNISRFPAHTVPILTSTVIECSKAGLKRSAFTYAAMLMRPENRGDIMEKYRKRIEQIVRKPEKEEVEEVKSPCPVCQFEFPCMELVCPGCKTNLPFCIMTGQHVLRDDLTVCPHCDFPALYSQLVRYSQQGSEQQQAPACPMCGGELEQKQIKIISDYQRFLTPEEAQPEDD